MGALRNHPAGKSLTVAVAGQPNTGKSTLFNRLTGLNQRVGNWTGKTVDRKEGAALWNGVAFTFVDLPGCYGMTPHSPEEEVARDYLLSGGPDAVLAVVNAASVERSLYIVSELVALGLPVVVALNMTDVAEQEGRAVDAVALSSALGLPVIPLVGTSADGTTVDALLRALAEASCPASVPAVPAKVSLLAEIIGAALPCAPLWAACKLFEGRRGAAGPDGNPFRGEAGGDPCAAGRPLGRTGAVRVPAGMDRRRMWQGRPYIRYGPGADRALGPGSPSSAMGTVGRVSGHPGGLRAWALRLA